MNTKTASGVRQITMPAEMQSCLRQLRATGRSVGLVPTMGALHEGHASLIRESLRSCDETVVTIFVNPTQFGPAEDLAAYPRSMERDIEALSEMGVSYLFAPSVESIYPRGFSTGVEPPLVARLWEGACRPGHFRGVATVVLKLFHIVPADVAYFGQKDYQQSLVIRRLVDDLNIPIRLQICPTVRDADGLALSSRNEYLSPGQRKQALAIPAALSRAKESFAAGVREAAAIASAAEQILADAGIERWDYLAVVDRHTLEPLSQIEDSAAILLAVHVGPTRLIDNLLLQT